MGEREGGQRLISITESQFSGMKGSGPAADR